MPASSIVVPARQLRIAALGAWQPGCQSVAAQQYSQCARGLTATVSPKRCCCLPHLPFGSQPFKQFPWFAVFKNTCEHCASSPVSVPQLAQPVGRAEARGHSSSSGGQDSLTPSAVTQPLVSVERATAPQLRVPLGAIKDSQDLEFCGQPCSEQSAINPQVQQCVQ